MRTAGRRATPVALDDDLAHRGRQPRRDGRAPGRRVRHGLRRPAVQHRQRAAPRRARTTPTRSPTTSASSRRAWSACASCSRRTARSTCTSTTARRTAASSLLDELFGPECFLNELIWIYDYGGRPKRRWPAKHDTILVYVRDRDRYHFDDDRGRPRAVHGARPRRAGEGGARQAPERLLVAHDRADELAREDRLPDAEAGGRSCGGWSPPRRGRAAGAWTPSPARARSAPCAASSGRRFVLVDANPEAIAVTTARLVAAAAAADAQLTSTGTRARLSPDRRAGIRAARRAPARGGPPAARR